MWQGGPFDHRENHFEDILDVNGEIYRQTKREKGEGKKRKKRENEREKEKKRGEGRKRKKKRCV